MLDGDWLLELVVLNADWLDCVTVSDCDSVVISSGFGVVFGTDTTFKTV